MSLHQSSVAERAVDARGTDGDDISVEHHEGQPPVAFQGMPSVEVEDGFLLPVFEPPVARNLAVVLVDLAVAMIPVVKLAGSQPEPAQQLSGGQLGALGPVVQVVDDLVAGVVGNPGSVQSSPSSFFSLTCSSMSSTMTSFF